MPRLRSNTGSNPILNMVRKFVSFFRLQTIKKSFNCSCEYAFDELKETQVKTEKDIESEEYTKQYKEECNKVWEDIAKREKEEQARYEEEMKTWEEQNVNRKSMTSRKQILRNTKETREKNYRTTIKPIIFEEDGEQSFTDKENRHKRLSDKVQKTLWGNAGY